MIKKVLPPRAPIIPKKSTNYALGEGRSAQKRLDFQNTLVKKHLIHALETASTMAPLKGSTVVDFGCGSSSAYETLYSFLGPRGTYIGIDRSKEHIALTNKRFKGKRYILGGEDSPEAEAAIATADVVYMRYVVMHQKQQKEFIHRIYNKLKPGAIFIVQEPQDTPERKAEMIEKYPYAGALCDFKSKIGEKLGLDYNFAPNLEALFKELRPSKLVHRAEDIYIPLKMAKKFYKEGITEIANKDKKKELLTDEDLAHYMEIISQLPEEGDNYWNIDFFHTYIVQKKGGTIPPESN